MKCMRQCAPSLFLVLFIAGCTLQEAKDTPSPSPSVPEAQTMQAGGPGGTMPQGMSKGLPPAMPGMNTAPLTKTPELDKKIADAEKSGDKKKIADAYAERGTFRMNDDAAGPRVKYRAALDDYRKALTVDPTNQTAAANKKMIEDIYRSMGRPIPGEDDSAAKHGSSKQEGAKPSSSSSQKP